MIHSHRRAFTLAELLIVVIILRVLIGLLLPAVPRIGEWGAKKAPSASTSQFGFAAQMAENNAARAEAAAKPVAPPPRARVQTFSAQVMLTPRLSVGTATP